MTKNKKVFRFIDDLKKSIEKSNESLVYKLSKIESKYHNNSLNIGGGTTYRNAIELDMDLNLKSELYNLKKKFHIDEINHNFAIDDLYIEKICFEHEKLKESIINGNVKAKVVLSSDFSAFPTLNAKKGKRSIVLGGYEYDYIYPVFKSDTLDKQTLNEINKQVKHYRMFDDLKLSVSHK